MARTGPDKWTIIDKDKAAHASPLLVLRHPSAQAAGQQERLALHQALTISLLQQVVGGRESGVPDCRRLWLRLFCRGCC